MRIEGLQRTKIGDRTRIEARFVYEEARLDPVTIYYEAGSPLADALEATPEAFVPSGYPIAQWEGERRLHVEGALDSTLASGLGRAGSLLASWYERCGPLALEPTAGLRELTPRAQPSTVALFTGGADAFAMLCENRRLYPLDHSMSIRTVVYAFGFSFIDFPDGNENPHMRARYEAQARRIEALGERLGFDVVRLETNVRRLDPTRDPFYFAAHSGAFLAPMLASPGFVTDACIASAGESGPVHTPHGSHPMLDVLYSTGAVRVHHMQPTVGRLEKLAMISDWEPAWNMLQVCHGWLAPTPDVINCGRCEKCVRTMVELVACGTLKRFESFPADDVSPEMIDAIEIKSRYEYITAAGVIEGLQRHGRGDLVEAIQSQVRLLPNLHPRGPNGVWRRRLARGFGPFRLRER